MVKAKRKTPVREKLVAAPESVWYGAAWDWVVANWWVAVGVAVFIIVVAVFA